MWSRDERTSGGVKADRKQDSNNVDADSFPLFSFTKSHTLPACVCDRVCRNPSAKTGIARSGQPEVNM